jgi:thiol-disulfide isomerase/thioredoxin
MMRRLMARISVAFLIAGVLLQGCTRKEAERKTEPAQQSAANVSEVMSVERRTDKAPNFSWRDSSGNIVSFDSLRGQAVFLNFWATWCGPCQSELPDLVELSNKFGNRHVRFIGVAMDRGPSVIEDVRTFVRNEKLSYQNVLGTDELAEAFGNVRLLPTSFLVDGNGNIVQTFVGRRSKESYESSITALLH